MTFSFLDTLRVYTSLVELNLALRDTVYWGWQDRTDVKNDYADIASEILLDSKFGKPFVIHNHNR